ncbi:MAG TPA: L-lactate dehydrogenase [Coriobacteriia bacterium]|nr:L-lactate dehydrogenase [Coriobacteriia bacterium]
MKVGIVGAGLVGATAAYALVMRGVGREVVLVDVDRERAASEADDITHAVPFAHPLTINSGGYEALEGCSVVVVAAGVGQRAGESRMELLGRNTQIFSQVIPSILAATPDAVLVVASNPVDVMTHIAARFAGECGAKWGCVFGSGTTLDTARFRTLIARRFGVDALHVHGYVLGEHGDSEVLAWSTMTVAGMPLQEFSRLRGSDLTDSDRQEVDDAVRHAAYRIIEGKRATYYGVGAAIARIVDTVLSDRRSVLTVCTPDEEVAGVRDVTVSLPRLVGGTGVLDTFLPDLPDNEIDALRASAKEVRVAIDEALQPLESR